MIFYFVLCYCCVICVKPTLRYLTASKSQVPMRHSVRYVCIRCICYCFFVFFITIRINDARTKLLLLFGPWEHWPQNSWAHGCIAPSDATRWRKHSGAQNLNAEPKNTICIHLYIYFFIMFTAYADVACLFRFPRHFHLFALQLLFGLTKSLRLLALIFHLLLLRGWLLGGMKFP